MKLYTDHTGKFQMYIPIKWEYKNPSLYHKLEEGVPQAFGIYGNLMGAFQISCKPVSEHISELISTRKEKIHTSDEKLVFTESMTIAGDVDFYAFSCAVDDHYIFATYIVKSNKRHIKKYELELSDVKKVLSTIKFIKPQYRNRVIALKRYDLFMASMATTIDMMNKATKKKAHIEYVALSANRIDALLRLSIILYDQIKNGNDDIDMLLLFQTETDRPIMERTIYKQALDKEIITQYIFDKLENLYAERNKVIHRFIITDIRTEDILKIASKYHIIEEEIDTIINNLEQEQVRLKVGIHANNPDVGKKPDDSQMKKIIYSIRDKHGNINIDEIIGEKIEK